MIRVMTDLTLTSEQIQQFLHTGHIIAVKHGERRKWIRENAPGWKDGQLMQALQEAGAIREGGTHFSGWEPCVEEITLHADPASVR